MNASEPRILSITRQPGVVEAEIGLRVSAVDLEGAPARLRGAEYDLVILDATPGTRIEDALAVITRADASAPVLIRAPQITAAEAFRLARLGVTQLLIPATARRQVAEAVEQSRTRQLARLAGGVRSQEWEQLLVGSSREMAQVAQLIRMVGPRRATVLITGETGTGKEVAARALHLAGPRRRAAMVAVNCSALPANLLEAELFGHVRGAFTGAIQNRAGRFEQANGGTLFLDEVADLPLDLQAKLLRVLQEREFQRLGSSETTHVDVRVIAATNCNLAERVRAGSFREDLYYRLNVVPIEMPPLRQRRSDIPQLVAHFLRKICGLEEIPLKTADSEAVEKLRAYHWPGNVRQLENSVEMAVALSDDRTVLHASDFSLPVEAARPAATSLVVAVPEDGLDYEETLSAIERSILDQALRKTGGNKKAAAQMLNLKRTTLAAKVRSLATLTGTG